MLPENNGVIYQHQKPNKKPQNYTCSDHHMFANYLVLVRGATPVSSRNRREAKTTTCLAGNGFFKTICSIQNKLCNLIVNNGSAKNLVSQKLVEYLKLPIKPHKKPCALGWVSKGNQIKVTQTCIVPLSIGRHYKENVLCDVLDMDVCHILLGRPWQFDNDVTYKGRDNVILFSWEGHKIAMTSVLYFNRKSNVSGSNSLIIMHDEEKLSISKDVMVTMGDEFEVLLENVNTKSKTMACKHNRADEASLSRENSGSSFSQVEETDTGQI